MKIFNNRIYIEDLDITISHVIGIEKLKNSSILITGATGTIGSFIADCLIRYNKIHNANIKLYLAGRNISKLKERFDNSYYLKYDLFCELDFNSKFDYIIHTAGNSHPLMFIDDPVGTIIGNIDSTKRLLDYLNKNGGKRLLYISSGEVYGQGNLELEEFEENYSGYTDTLNSRFCYPISKRAAENLCASYFKQYGLETVIVRPCHTYGPGITPEDSRANAQFFRDVINGQNIIIKSKGRQLRSYIYVSDCVSAILTVLINGNVGEAYNIANPNSRVTIAGLAEIIAKIRNLKVVFRIPDGKDILQQSPIEKQVLSSQKLEKLGWKPAFDIELGIEHTINILMEGK